MLFPLFAEAATQELSTTGLAILTTVLIVMGIRRVMGICAQRVYDRWSAKLPACEQIADA